MVKHANYILCEMKNIVENSVNESIFEIKYNCLSIVIGNEFLFCSVAAML